MVVFHLFEKLRYSNDKSTKFESLYPKMERLYGLGGPQNLFVWNFATFATFARLPFGQPLKTLKLGYIAFHSVIF